MDGSGSAFLWDTLLTSGRSQTAAGNILYMEDFEREHEAPVEAPDPDSLGEMEKAATQAREALEAAQREGYAKGMSDALAEQELVEAQLHNALLQNLNDELNAARSSLEHIAASQALETAQIVISLLQASIPATMANNARLEVEAILNAILPSMSCEPELRVRTHQRAADRMREYLAPRLPTGKCILSVLADPGADEGEIQVSWLGGEARRNPVEIWHDIATVLGPLALPSIEEICCGHGS